MNQRRYFGTNFVYCMRYAPTEETAGSSHRRPGEKRHRAQVRTNLTHPLNGETWQVPLMGEGILLEFNTMHQGVTLCPS